MAIFFWILIAATILVAAATLAPAYAERRRALARSGARRGVSPRPDDASRPRSG
jgi:hypothetical protein